MFSQFVRACPWYHPLNILVGYLLGVGRAMRLKLLQVVAFSVWSTGGFVSPAKRAVTFLLLLIICALLECVSESSPWYNHRGWLGIKKHYSILLFLIQFAYSDLICDFTDWPPPVRFTTSDFIVTWPFVWYCVRLCCCCVEHLTVSVLAPLVCCYCVCTSRSQSLLLAPESTCCGHSVVFWCYSAYCDDMLHLSRLLGSCSQAVVLYIVMVPPQCSRGGVVVIVETAAVLFRSGYGLIVWLYVGLTWREQLACWPALGCDWSV